MRGSNVFTRAGGKAVRVGMLCLAAVLAGCSSSGSDLFGTTQASTGGAGTPGPLAGAFSQTTGSQAAGEGNQPSLDDLNCPSVTVREGASTYAIGRPGAAVGELSPLDVRYQGTFGQTARECSLASGTMHMKIGVQGRVILGPAGGPGQLELPVRYALVREGPESQTLWTKFHRIPVSVPEGVPHVAWTHVEPELSFPLPKNTDDLRMYFVYVGFDPLGKPDTPKKPAKPPARPRRQ